MKEKSPEIFIENLYLLELKNLPWHLELEKWENRGIKFFNFRSGISRHPVRFFRTRYSSFAVKQTSIQIAELEISNYKKLLSAGIHTIVPAGYVVSRNGSLYVQTKTGIKYEEDGFAFVITLLEEKALPDSHLYKLNFRKENLKIIWDAVAGLLAELHFNNFYWGDASLANVLIRFFKTKDEKGRVKTELKAVLVDAETVKVFPRLSYEKRAEDVRFFFDSMYWLNEDYKKAGYTRKNFTTSQDKKYILKKYNEEYIKLKKIKAFEKETGINVRRYFYQINNIYGLESIKKQIDEHKWYLSEKAKKEVNITDASQSWLNDIYFPIINEFEKLDIFEYFPFTNSVSLYVDVMTHKYFLSKEAGKDVGIEKAIRDYSKKYAADSSFIAKMKNIFEDIKKLFY